MGAPGDWVQQATIGPIGTNIHLRVRIPTTYLTTTPLARLRLRMGDGSYDATDPFEQYFPLDEDETTFVTSAGDFSYYDVEIADKPAGVEWQVQSNTLFQLDPNRVTVPSVGSVTDDQILDTAKETRTTADRGKYLGTSAMDENDVVLLDAPAGGASAPWRVERTAPAAMSPVRFLRVDNPGSGYTSDPTVNVAGAATAGGITRGTGGQLGQLLEVGCRHRRIVCDRSCCHGDWRRRIGRRRHGAAWIGGGWR